MFLAPSLAFYFLPSRIWELLTGGLLALSLVRAPRSPAERLCARWLGLAAIGLCVVFYRGNLSYPGFAALPPVLGAALVIWAGMGEGGAPRVLGHPWLVFLGRISYPLYLWHLPVFAAVYYLRLTPPSPPVLLGWALVCLLLSVATWRIVERPLRVGGRLLPPWRVILPAGAVMGLLGLFGGALYLADGAPGRFPPEMRPLAEAERRADPAAKACRWTSLEDLEAGRFCHLGESGLPRDTLLWGDSVAEALAPGLEAAAARRGQGILLAYFYGCSLAPPEVPEGRVNRRDRDCRDHRRAVLAGLAARPDIRRVVLAHRWLFPARNEDIEGLATRLRGWGKRVYAVAPAPELRQDPPHALHIQALGFDRQIDLRPGRADFERHFAPVRRRLDALAASGGARVLDPAPLLCPEERCRILDGPDPLYYDKYHLSPRGALAVSPIFDEVFD